MMTKMNRRRFLDCAVAAPILGAISNTVFASAGISRRGGSLHQDTVCAPIIKNFMDAVLPSQTACQVWDKLGTASVSYERVVDLQAPLIHQDYWSLPYRLDVGSKIIRKTWFDGYLLIEEIVAYDTEAIPRQMKAMTLQEMVALIQLEERWGPYKEVLIPCGYGKAMSEVSPVYRKIFEDRVRKRYNLPAKCQPIAVRPYTTKEHNGSAHVPGYVTVMDPERPRENVAVVFGPDMIEGRADKSTAYGSVLVPKNQMAKMIETPFSIYAERKFSTVQWPQGSFA